MYSELGKGTISRVYLPLLKTTIAAEEKIRVKSPWVMKGSLSQMTGLELAREALIIRPDFPIILCSGFSPTIPPYLTWINRN